MMDESPAEDQLREENAELRAHLRSRLGEQVVRVLSQLFKWAGLAAIVYFVTDAVGKFAGQETLAKIYLAFLADIKADLPKWLAYVFGAGGAGYGINQRRLRRKNTSYLAPRIAELEKLIDPKRSSSELPPSGTTREEDQP